MNMFHAVSARLEDAVLELCEAVKGNVQRLFGKCIEQVLESFVCVCVQAVCIQVLGWGGWLFAADGAKHGQGQQSDAIYGGAHCGEVGRGGANGGLEVRVRVEWW